MMGKNKIYKSFNEFKQDYFPLDSNKKHRLLYGNEPSETGRRLAKITIANTKKKINE